MEIEAAGTAIGPPVKLDEDTKLDSLVAVAKEGLDLERVSDGQAVGSYQLKLAKKASRIEYGKAASLETARKGQATLARSTTWKSVLPSDLQLQAEGSETEDGKDVLVTVTLHLRSPQDILYYLGQIIRLETVKNQVPQLTLARGKGEHEIAPLFVAFPENHRASDGTKCRRV